MTEKKKSLHLVSGIALGAAVAAGATFLYKTKQGKKVRKEFAGYLDDAKLHLSDLVKNIKSQAKKLEDDLKDSDIDLAKKTKKVKRQVNKTADIIKKKVFLKSGKPLAN